MTDSVQSKSKGSDSSSALDRRGTLLTQDDESKSKRKSHRQKYLSKLGLEGVENLSKYEKSEEDGSDDELTVKYSVQILGTDLRKIKGEKSFTVYKVEITRDISSWLIYRRYSQFFSLFSELKSEFGVQRVPKKFPPKVIKQNLSPQNIDRRHQMLEEWLTAVLSDLEMRQHESVQVFIRQGKEDVDFVPRQRNSVLSDIDIQSPLYKLHNGKWKDRYFVLRHGLLYKYETKEDKHPFNFYDVRAAVATAQEDKQPKAKTNLFPFTLEVPDRKKKHVTTHYFAADSEEQRSSWIALINKEARLNNSNKVFGVALEDVRERDENGVPLFLSAMLTFLQTTAHDRDDLFTQPPDEKIKKEIDEGNSVDLQSVVNDVHAVAGLIVQYLHELPQPIIKHEYQDCLFGIFKIQDEEKRNKMFKHFSEIVPIINRNLLIKLFSFLSAISKHGETKRERLVKIFGRLVIRPATELDHSFLTFLFNQMVDNWPLLEVEGEKYVPVLATKRRSVSLAKRESKRNLAENREVNKDKSNKDNTIEQTGGDKSVEKKKDAPKSPRKEKSDKANSTKKVKEDKGPKNDKKDREPKDTKVKKPKTPKKDQKDGEHADIKPEVVQKPNKENEPANVNEEKDAPSSPREDIVNNPKKNVGFEQKDDEPKGDAQLDNGNNSARSSAEVKADVKVLSLSTSTKSTRMRIVSELSHFDSIEKKEPQETNDANNSNATAAPSATGDNKKDDSSADVKNPPDTQETAVVAVTTPRAEDLSVSEDSEIDSSDSEASSTSEASNEPASTASVPRIELDSTPIVTIEGKGEPDTPHKDSSDEGEFETRTSPRLSIAIRPKATKKNRPTSARVSIPPGAIPPTEPESKANKPPSIVVISPKQQLIADLNKALGNRSKK